MDGFYKYYMESNNRMARTGKSTIQVMLSPSVIDEVEKLVHEGRYASVSDLGNCAIKCI